ncbi:hypothetical protein EKO23_12840 [Nocardioides guangzhouensis]|uniref:Branched-chain amino acid ABC transporter permease n=1 Tax=Nocardioides guangzhouensis TaxID=2497878 RepID=A0A4Q4ZBQ1_9ACTN|nr:AzlC family ABC transporter permease [Nocardioides guangzhouensis]RYP85363.1 hypothetical protein EKO23_12840 [Nocardioides guangzhouensis]
MTTTVVPDALRPDLPALDRRELRRRARADVLAVAPGVMPFGLVLGVTVVALGGSRAAALFGAAAVYGGSAQLTTTTVLHLGSGFLAAVAAGVVVNARVMLYGAALEPMFRHQPRWFRLLGPQFLLDQTYLAATRREASGPAEFRRYWGWLGTYLLLAWLVAVAVGLALGPLLPPLPHLGLVGVALFVAMLVPRLVSRTVLLVAGTSGAVAIAVAHLVPEVSILSGCAAGVLAGIVADRPATPGRSDR